MTWSIVQLSQLSSLIIIKYVRYKILLRDTFSLSLNSSGLVILVTARELRFFDLRAKMKC